MIEMIKTKSIYDPKEEADGIRILITRYWPRDIKKENFNRWYKELSPSKDLLKSYKTNKIDFQSLERLFLQEIEKSNVIEIFKETVNEIIKGKNVTFLCYEKMNQIVIENL
jgi:uncharacterized protein YeaO (DUF488 family)